MGEFEGVLNGVHFRTRHNDYKVKTFFFFFWGGEDGEMEETAFEITLAVKG